MGPGNTFFLRLIYRTKKSSHRREKMPEGPRKHGAKVANQMS